ncbi:MAG: HAD hydrolase-like protein [Lachnospiraceae bacterium]|nr:HAD hydrolase-like protein [Lachnospiraceae bacterium]
MNILFDLDGTLIDTGIGIKKGIEFAVNAMGLDYQEDLSDLFIGPPLKDSFVQFYHMSGDDAEIAVKKYREYYGNIGLFQYEIYDGVVAMLKKLQDNQYDLYVATSKPEEYAKRILEHAGMRSYFRAVIGATFDKDRNTKTEVIEYALNMSIRNKGASIMVGDRKHDVLGGKTFGMRTIGVTYGYGSREELETARADVIIDTPISIVDGIVYVEENNNE